MKSGMMSGPARQRSAGLNHVIAMFALSVHPKAKTPAITPYRTQAGIAAMPPSG
jgi:hypothetical protein